MSDWGPWVDFVHGTAANKYADGATANAAEWHISVNHMTEGKFHWGG